MAKTMLFNPYTGKPRDPRDIASDPDGKLMVDPDEPLRAASKFSCYLQRDHGKAPCDHDCGKLRCMYPSKEASKVEPVAEKLYVTCHECSNCGHIGINDESETESACNTCGWHGPSPREDKCPECKREGTMSSACPECGNHYHLLAETRIAHPSPQALSDEEIKRIHDEQSCLPDLVGRKEQWPEILRFARAILAAAGGGEK